MLDLLNSLVAVIAILLATFGLGRPLVRRLAIVEDDLPGTLVWSLALGFAAAGVILSLLSLTGCLYVGVVLLFTCGAGLWGLGEVLCVWMAWRGSFFSGLTGALGKHETDGCQTSPALIRGLMALAGLAALGSLVSALAPSTSPEALSRHLELSKTFLLSHGVVRLPYGEYGAGPLLVEMWYAWALALDGAVAAGLLQWVFGLLLAVSTVLLARPLLRARTSLVAGALVLLTPGVAYQMTAPLDDLALALFTTLLLAAWWQAVVRRASPNWLVAAGAMAGAAMGTKSVGLVFVAALLVDSMPLARRMPGRDRLPTRPSAIALLAALVVAGPWYLRAIWLGEPIAAYETSRQLIQQVGALAVAVVPGLLLVRLSDRELNRMLRVGLIYALVSAACFPHVRWWAPLVPLLSLTVSMVGSKILGGRDWAHRVAQLGFAGLAAAAAAMPLVDARGRLAVAIGWQSREDYLFLHQPTYAAAFLANRLVRPGDHILSQDPRTFYFSCLTTSEDAYDRQATHTRTSDERRPVSQRLRSAGFTHVLLAEPAVRAPTHADNSLGSLLAEELNDPGQSALLPLAEYERDEDPLTARRYRLLKLR